MRHIRRFAALGGATIVVACVFVGTALAQSPSGQGYGGQAGAPLGDVAQPESGVAGVQTGSQAVGVLPFTGIDLALLVAGGLVLTAVGAGLVRAGARR
jgi:hypothetical protein